MKRLETMIFIAAMATSAQAAQTIQFSNYSWQVEATNAVVEQFSGRKSLRLYQGMVWLENAEFSDGVIEFELFAESDAQGFFGASWRAKSTSDYEEFYIRTHLSGKPDAVQYTPVFNGLSAWQIHSDENSIASTPIAIGRWLPIKMVIEGDTADVYVDSETPVLHIPDLKTDIARGGLALRATGQMGWFANFRYRELEQHEHVVAQSTLPISAPDNLIRSWQVSQPVAESSFAAMTELPPTTISKHHWTPLSVETNGIANLARVARKSAVLETVMARTAIHSTSSEIRLMHFGYSDRVRIYLNGKLLFAGNAAWRSRDYRFLGTVGFEDAVALHLLPGENELIAVVSETFGGWAIAAYLERSRD